MQISRSRHATASSTQPKTILSRAFATLVAPAVISMALLGGTGSAGHHRQSARRWIVQGPGGDHLCQRNQFRRGGNRRRTLDLVDFCPSGTVGRNITPLLLELVGGGQIMRCAPSGRRRRSHRRGSTPVSPLTFRKEVRQSPAAISSSLERRHPDIGQSGRDIFRRRRILDRAGPDGKLDAEHYRDRYRLVSRIR